MPVLDRRAVAAGPGEAPPIVHDVLQAPGAPLDTATRDAMQRHLGADLGHVRIHTDARAAESARAVSALAYTVGSSIVFDSGRYAPGAADGRLPIGPAQSAAEREACRTAAALDTARPHLPAGRNEAAASGPRSGARAGSTAQTGSTLLQRLGDDEPAPAGTESAPAAGTAGDAPAPAQGDERPAPAGGEAVPATRQGDPVALDDEAPKPCPSGATESFPAKADVPITVVADSPSGWLTDVATQLAGDAGHVKTEPDASWCISADGQSVEGVTVTVALTKKVARPQRGHGLSGAANDAKWKVVQDMAKSINDHENKHASTITTALKGIAQKMKNLKPAKGAKLTDADVQKAFDDAVCAAMKLQEDLDAKEGLIKVNPDELGFTTAGVKQDYTHGCAAATPAKPAKAGGGAKP